MSYNWKCCSFYPNDFGASALLVILKINVLKKEVFSPLKGYSLI